MTTKEAREIYLRSDCSYFRMCNKDFANYIEYRKFGPTKEQEMIWKNEKIQILYREVRSSGRALPFERLYRIAEEFHDYEKLKIMCDALPFLSDSLSPKERVSVAELLLGKKAQKARSGLIYWAYDSKQRGMTLLFIDEAIHLLDISQDLDNELCKRVKKARRLCVKIIDELNFNVNFMKDKIGV